MANWVPRGQDRAKREVLVEGVPAYMEPAVLKFLRPHFARVTTSGSWFLDENQLIEYDLVARQEPSYVERRSAGISWPGFVKDLPDDDLLDMADWVIHRNNHAAANALEAILEAGGSVWTTGRRDGNVGLVRRMPESVQRAVEVTLQQGTAGQILGQAWAAAYGRVPDPEEAYEKAIKAVEEAAVGIVSPNNQTATLGTVIRDMSAQGDWVVDLPGRDREVALVMARALWTGQESRHGGNGYRQPTQGEAETSVTLAVSLLQLFSSGSVARRP